MRWISYPLWFFIVGAIAIYSCGGGSSNDNNIVPPGQNQVLSWEQPPQYEDNTVLDLIKDVDHYHVYISNYPWFDNNAQLAAEIAGVVQTDNAGTVPSTSFNLENLRKFGINADNNAKFIYMSTQTIDGGVSDINEPIQWGNSQMEMEVTPE